MYREYVYKILFNILSGMRQKIILIFSEVTEGFGLNGEMKDHSSSKLELAL